MYSEFKFKAGDHVVHKSGTGPEMAVVKSQFSNLTNQVWVTCQWLDWKNELKEHDFLENVLQECKTES
jgi:uncharacterized protein YodC (DUF2158 family)